MEIERKFLIWENGGEFATDLFYNKFGNLKRFIDRIRSEGNTIRQGYLDIASLEGELLEIRKAVKFTPVEARLRSEGVRLDGKTEYKFTLKGKGDLARNEHEVAISQSIFQHYWSRTLGRRVLKDRLKVPYNGQEIEFDRYSDRNLVIAEIEFQSREIADSFPALGDDITNDIRYKNKNLAR